MDRTQDTTNTNRYLNIILTVNALMLAVMIFTQVKSVAGPQQAAAQSRTTFPKKEQPLVINASGQRVAILNEVKALRGAMEKMSGSLDGEFKVNVTNFDDIDFNAGN